MSQNISTAVMQRRKVAPDSLDYFPTPPFATRALCEFLEGEPSGGGLADMSVWEPACGEMHMVRPLAEYFGSVRASDVHRYTPEHELLDFAFLGEREPPVDYVISNPPFRLAQEFIETGLKVTRKGVAMLLRSAFLEGQGRYEQLFSKMPPTHILQFVERVAMLEGRLVRTGDIDPFAQKEGATVSSATAYCWFVWMWGADPETRLRWIAPCRKRLERDGDYPDYAAVFAARPDRDRGGFLDVMEASPSAVNAAQEPVA